MSLLQFLRDARGPLTRADRRRWAAARNLPDLRELTVQWLEGDIASQPGYYGRVDVDETPGLTRALIACNRNGFLTASSQAGYVGEGYGGHTWKQLAAVDGYATPETAQQIKANLRGYSVKLSPLRRRRDRGVVVTWCEGTPYTTFGGVSIGDATSQYTGCSREAIKAIREAWAVTVYDHRPGENALWADLERAAKRGRW